MTHINLHDRHAQAAVARNHGARLLSTAPVRGEVRFCKNRFAHRLYDVMIPVLDFRCNRWESGRAGHQAQAGIAKLEGNRADWATTDHCAACTGGGMWSVRG
jgi:hypothetical protein